MARNQEIRIIHKMNKLVLRKHKFRTGLTGKIIENKCIVCGKLYLSATKSRGGRNSSIRPKGSRTCSRKCSRDYNHNWHYINRKSTS